MILVDWLIESTILYSQEELLNIGLSHQVPITSNFWNSQQISTGITSPPASPWINLLGSRPQRPRRRRKQKRGCRCGYLARLKRAPSTPPLPSLLVANARSLCNKMDELRLDLLSSSSSVVSRVMIITETWLNHVNNPGPATELTGCSIHCSDRTKDCGTSCGGELRIYVNNSWCTNTDMIDKHRSPELEFLAVKCRPFHLPREFSVVNVTSVSIPPDANARLALGYMVAAEHSSYPDDVFIVAGDFNHVNLKTVLPKFDQHVSCANILDCVYSNITKGYRATPPLTPRPVRSIHPSIF